MCETHLETGKTDNWRLDLKEFERGRVTDMPDDEPSRRFYKAQNDIIDTFVRSSSIRRRSAGHRPVRDDDDDEDGDQSGRTKCAVSLSFAANVALVAIKLIAAVMSGSLAVVASTVDSFLDILSGSIIFLAARAARKRDPCTSPLAPCARVACVV